MSLAELRSLPSYGASVAERQRLFTPALAELSRHHYGACDGYRRIVDGLWGGPAALAPQRLDEAPYLPVSLFKRELLHSVPLDTVTSTMTSSGTTGQAVSRIGVDRDCSSEQQRCLADSMAFVLGPKRLPMLVLDTPSVLSDSRLMSARGAGVLGMMRFGHRPTFLLDRDGEPDEGALDAFLQAHGHAPFFLFGFTFMVWSALYLRFAGAGLDLGRGTLVHSGGWKVLTDQAVDNAVFRAALREAFELHEVFNFYGMVEQLGSIFLEGPDGLLYPPNFSDVIVRDPLDLEPVPDGEPGLVQVLSLVPRSYPGHSLLTEDLGVIEARRSGDAPCGSGLRLLGRLPRAELRGCSDVIAAEGTASR